MNEEIVVAQNGAHAPTATPAKPPSYSDIKITIKRSKHEVEIDMDKLTWDDGKKLRKLQQRAEADKLSEDEQILLMDEFIQKVTGRDPNTMPMEVVNRIVAVLFAEDADAAAAEKN